MSAATHTTTPPGTVANACYTRAIRLATGKSWTISTRAKPKAYQTQIQKQTDNQQQTSYDANLKSMLKASQRAELWATKENRGLAAIKILWPGPGIIISDYATCALISEKIALSPLKIEHCWLSKCLSIPLTGWLFNLIRYPSKWNKENDRNMIEKQNETVLVTCREKKPIPSTC